MKKILFLVGESGCGKTTLQRRLNEQFPQKYSNILSPVTREPREGEIDGLSYHFDSRSEFEKSIKREEFLQYVEFSDNYYGTKYREYEKTQDVGIFVCTPIGVSDTIEGLKRRFGTRFEFNVVFMLASKGLLISHGVHEDRINRGNISQEFVEMFIGNRFDEVDSVTVITDADINHELAKKINLLV